MQSKEVILSRFKLRNTVVVLGFIYIQRRFLSINQKVISKLVDKSKWYSIMHSKRSQSW